MMKGKGPNIKTTLPNNLYIKEYLDRGYISHSCIIRELCKNNNCVRVRHPVYQRTSGPGGEWERPASASSQEVLGPCAPPRVPALSLNNVQKEKTRGRSRETGRKEKEEERKENV